MAVSIPQVVTEDRASGAQFIDGSLKFNSAFKNHLEKDFSSDGNRRIWTWSAWVKKPEDEGFADDGVIFEARIDSPSADADIFGIRWRTNGRIIVYDTGNSYIGGSREFRDTNAFYHLVLSVDTTQASNNISLYVNGDLYLQGSYTQNSDTRVNSSAATHRIGARTTVGGQDGHFLSSQLSQVYLIDGQALDASYFGFTDELTNTWRPKKYDGTFGTNGFWLPMDGNTPIGKDQSGNGNDWTPVNFGGSNTIEKATGALPILNTDGSGNIARPGTRNDAYASDIVMAIPFLGDINDISADVRGSGSNLTVTSSGSPADDSYPSQWYGSSFNVSTSNYINTIGTTTTFAFLHQPEAAGTVEGWINTNAVNVQGPWFQTSNGTDEVGVMFRQNSTTNLAVQINRGVSGQAISVDSSVTVALNTWYHWAFVKSADGYAQFFLNGVPTGDKVPISTAAGASYAASTNTSSSFAGRIARNHGESRGVGANISDYRAYTIQKYAFDTPFIPASSNPDILPDTPSGVSGKSKLTKVTDGAVAFDGTGDYLSTSSSSSDFTFGTGDFTIEMFLYNRETGGKGFIQFSDTAGGLKQTSSGVVTIHKDGSSHVFRAYVKNGSTPFSTMVPYKRWCHVALVRESGTIKLFVDGKQDATTVSNDTTNYATTYVAIGGYYDTNYLSDCTISNVRVNKGTALYTSDFTPPTAPLTNITNTKLLCCQSNTSAAAAAVQPTTTNTRIPSGFSWWDAGATAGWNKAGSNTSGANSDYVAVALPTSGKIYWETVVRNPATYRVIGVTDDGGNAPGNAGYQDNTSGFYFNGNPPIYLAKRSGASSTSSQVTHGASTGTTWESGDIIMWAVDCGSSRMWIGRNGTWYASGNPAGGTNYAFHNMNVHTGGTYFKLAYATNSGGPATFEIKTEANSALLAEKGNASGTTFNPFIDDINAIRGQETGYATLNPLDVSLGVIANRGTTLSDGNLTSTVVSGADNKESVANISATSGKYYYEVMFDPGANSNNSDGAGWVADDGLGVDNSTTGGFMMIARDIGSTIVGNGNGSRTNQSAGTHPFNYYPGDVMGCAIDLDSRIATWYKNGQKHSFVVDFSSRTNLNGLDFKPLILNRLAGSVFANFGQKPFKFPPPDGFQPLNLSNVQPEKVIARPDQYVSATLFTGTGDGVSSRTVELPQDADLVWAKSRDRTSSNQLLDTVRGNNLVLQTNSTINQRNPITQYTGGGLSTIDGKTVTIASGTTNNQNLNVSGNRGVIWSWKAGGSKNTFNIDDVGYANASDVNMNVGGLNSSAYDQSQTWSSFWSATGNGIESSNPATKSFDGVLTGLGMRLNGSSSCTWAPTGGYSYSGDFLIYACKDNDYTNVSWTVVHAGGTTDITDSVAAGTTMTELNLTNLGIQSPITSLSFTSNNNSNPRIAGMRAGGKLLVDSGVSVTNVPSIAATGSSVGTKQGFSIVKFDGNSTTTGTIAHGLNKKPQFIIVKDLVNSDDWQVKFVDENRYFKLNGTDTGSTSYSNYTATDSVIKLGYTWNNDSSSHIAYSWHDVPGLQKFGTYEGNTTEGAFVELGFRPAIILIKSIDQTWYWNIHDSKRSPINPAQGNFLRPDQNFVEGTASGNNNIDFLSNGFKIRSISAQSEPTNVNGQTYFYAAWAEAPAVNLYGSQANAR